MAWTGRRTGAAVVAGAALAGGTYLAGPSSAGAAAAAPAAAVPVVAAPASTTAAVGWQRALATARTVAAPAEVTPAEVTPAITGARTLRFTGRLIDFEFVDVGREGDSPGDLFVFEQRLHARNGDRVGREVTRCMLSFTTVRCDSTFSIRGQGTFETAQAIVGRPLLAVTGGTGDFRNVRGQARLLGGTETTTEFQVTLLP